VDILLSLASFWFFLIARKAEHVNVPAFQLSAGSSAGGLTQHDAFQQFLLFLSEEVLSNAFFISRLLLCVPLCSIFVVPCGDEYFYWIYKFGGQIGLHVVAGPVVHTVLYLSIHDFHPDLQ
jgi:hypothetical protein